ncbi:DNA alkylation repair protein [Cellulomonas sp. URHE0023]|uniref:DNA alkylation repair protein n=1 Tax=Cellulomonas sp. URHE0023 TaxID=1380354 RepID=UPI0005512180|nr:DNA alkylation repair protein [Cellulomonas sp. URHE0023]
MTVPTTAREVLARLDALRTDEQLAAYERYFPLDERGDDVFIGVRMGDVFTLAKTAELPLDEVEVLLDSDVHEARVCAVSILDARARRPRTTDDDRRALYDLYLRRHDRINTWDLVDRAALHVVGRYLETRDRAPLYELAASADPYERRTAIVATMYYLRAAADGADTADTFAIAALLLDDDADTVHKGVGWALRTAGGEGLTSFLDEHAARMPRVMLRAAVERLPKDERARYLSHGPN